MSRTSIFAFRAVAAVVVLGVLVLGALAAFTAPAKDQPSIILLVSMSLGFGVLIGVIVRAVARR